MSYLGAAESWAAGHGLRIPYAAWSDPDSTSPLRSFAPAFPITIGVAIKLGAPPVAGARAVQALAAAFTAATLAWLLDLLAGSFAAAVGVVAILLSPAVIGDYIAILSEPLFLAFLAVALLLMVTKPERPLAYGMPAAAAASVRYAGVSLVAAAVLWAFVQPGDRRTRIRRAAAAAIPTIMVAVLWLARTYRMTHHAPLPVERPTMAVGDALSQAWSSVALTLAPALDETRWFHPVAVVALLLAILVIARDAIPADGARAHALRRIVTLFSLCYALTVLAAKLFVGHDIPLDLRILSPLVLCGALVLADSLSRTVAQRSVLIRTGVTAGIVVWMTGAVVEARELVDDISANGYDFAQPGWRTSETVAWLKVHGAGYALYTNHPVPIFYYLHRPSRDLPTIAAPDTLRRFAARFSASPSALVAFSDTTWRAQVPGAVLARRLNLRVAARLKDGTVWVGPASLSGATSSP